MFSGIDRFHFMSMEKGFIGEGSGCLGFNGIHVLEPFGGGRRTRQRDQTMLAVAGNYSDSVQFYDLDAMVNQHGVRVFNFGIIFFDFLKFCVNQK